MADLSIELEEDYEEELQEDDEIDEEVELLETRLSNRRLNSESPTTVTSERSRPVMSKSHRKPPRSSNSNGNMMHGMSSPNGIPRTPKVQGGGSAHRRRTLRRNVTDKAWGNASMPLLSVRDIVGSEKKATAVGMVAGAASPRKRNASNHSQKPRDSTSVAEQKRTNIRSRKKERGLRQNDVKNSLSSFLSKNQPDDSDNDIYLEGGGDESLHSEGEDHQKYKMSSNRSLGNLGERNDYLSDDGASVKSSKSHSRSVRRRRTLRSDGNLTDGDTPDHSQRRQSSTMLRRRLKSDTKDSDDRSVVSRSRRASRRGSRQLEDDSPRQRRSQSVDAEKMQRRRSTSVDAEKMQRGRDSNSDDKKYRRERSSSRPRDQKSVRSRSVDAEKMQRGRDSNSDDKKHRRERSSSRPRDLKSVRSRSVDAEKMQRGRNSNNDAKKNPRDRSSSRGRDYRGDDKKNRRARSSSRRRKTSSARNSDGDRQKSGRRRAGGDADERSVGSRKSAGGRRRRHHRTKKQSSQQDVIPPKIEHTHDKNPDTSPPISPMSSPPNSQQSLLNSPSKREGKDRLTSLSSHLESAPFTKSKAIQEDKSETSSRFSGSYDQPTTIIQFDPSTANNITMISQSKANVTKEKFTHADGTESELHISELAGLPTFEAVPPDDGEESLGSLHQSLGSIDYNPDEIKHKSMSSIDYNAKADLGFQRPGQKSKENEVVAQAPTRRGRPSNNRSTSTTRRRGVSASKSLLARMRKNEKPPRVPSNEATNFQESVRGFFGAFNKKGEQEEEGDFEEEGHKSGRFFFRREEIEHQALDDDGSLSA